MRAAGGASPGVSIYRQEGNLQAGQHKLLSSPAERRKAAAERKEEPCLCLTSCFPALLHYMCRDGRRHHGYLTHQRHLPYLKHVHATLVAWQACHTSHASIFRVCWLNKGVARWDADGTSGDAIRILRGTPSSARALYKRLLPRLPLIALRLPRTYACHYH